MLKKILAISVVSLSLNAFAIDAQKALEIAENNGFKAGMIRKVEKKDGSAFFVIRRAFADTQMRIDAQTGEIIKPKSKKAEFSLIEAVKKAQEQGEVIGVFYISERTRLPMPKSDKAEGEKSKRKGFYVAKVLKEGAEQRFIYSGENGDLLEESEELKKLLDGKKPALIPPVKPKEPKAEPEKDLIPPPAPKEEPKPETK